MKVYEFCNCQNCLKERRWVKAEEERRKARNRMSNWYLLSWHEYNVLEYNPKAIRFLWRNRKYYPQWMNLKWRYPRIRCLIQELKELKQIIGDRTPVFVAGGRVLWEGNNGY